MPYKEPTLKTQWQKDKRAKLRGEDPKVKTRLPEDPIEAPVMTRTELMGNLAERLRLAKVGKYTFKEKEYQKAVRPLDPDSRIAFIQKELNDPYFIDGIERAGRLFDDREARYEAAYRYKVKQGGVVHALVDDRKKLERIHQSLKDHKLLEEVRHGCDGPTFDVVGELLEATA